MGASTATLTFSYSGFLTRFLLEFGLRVNYEVVALEDIYKSSTHGSSNSKRSLRYDHFREVAHVDSSQFQPLLSYFGTEAPPSTGASTLAQFHHPSLPLFRWASVTTLLLRQELRQRPFSCFSSCSSLGLAWLHAWQCGLAPLLLFYAHQLSLISLHMGRASPCLSPCFVCGWLRGFVFFLVATYPGSVSKGGLRLGLRQRLFASSSCTLQLLS